MTVQEAFALGYQAYILQRQCYLTQPDLIAAWQSGYNTAKLKLKLK